MAEAPSLPPGIRLEDGESIVRTAKDWGTSVRPLVLTTLRLICPVDPSGGGTAVIRLRDVHEVRLRKSLLGFSTVIIEYGDHARAAFPAHINAKAIRADIAAAVEAAPRPSTPTLSVVQPEPAASRYEKLRQIGELRDAGVLTQPEFEEEKARILKEP
jgi:hypothetical protein